MADTKAPTSSDVARRAGVSRMTVSAVLNGAGNNVRVSDATRQRVLDAAAELRYVPHRAAQALRRRRSGVLGFVPRANRGTPEERPVAYSLSVEIARAAIRNGYHIIEASAETAETRRGEELARFLLSWRVDGVILDSPESDEEVRRFLDQGLPVVQLMRPRVTVPTPMITVDATEGIISAVTHLVDLGHQRIAFIGTHPDHVADRRRLDAYRSGMATHGLSIPDELVQFGTRSSLMDDGYSRTRALLALTERPTAILATGDNVALGTLRALYEARVYVPDDVSLISYDDALAGQLYPPLTSVGQPFPRVAEHAIALISRCLAQSDDLVGAIDAAEHIDLPTRLTVRSSTAPPAS